jgi:hypothetical protein
MTGAAPADGGTALDLAARQPDLHSVDRPATQDQPSPEPAGQREPTPVPPPESTDAGDSDVRHTQVDVTPTAIIHPGTPSTIQQEPVTPTVSALQAEALHTTAEIPADHVPLTAVQLAVTHTGSEQKLYAFLYEAIQLTGVPQRQFTHREMSDKTGLRSTRTIKDALRGLIEKRSIEVVNIDLGNTAGSEYRIYSPTEIQLRRRNAGISIDPRTKRALIRPGPNQSEA